MVDFSKIEFYFARFAFKIDTASRKSLWLKLSKLIGNGVQLITALEDKVKRRIASGQSTHPEVIAIQHWLKHLKNGKRLSDAIQGWVTDEERVLIAAGEQSGKVQSSLISTVKIMTFKANILSEVRKSLVYPVILISASISTMYLFSYKIIPVYERIVPNDYWKGIAKSMVATCHFVQSYMLIVLVVLAVLIAIFVASLPRFDGPIRVFFDRYTPYNLYRIVNGSTWLVSFAALNGAGLRTETCLQQLMVNGSPWLRRRTEACLKGIRAGLNPGEALQRSGYEFPDLDIIDDLNVYSTMNGFDTALEAMGNEWIEESVIQIKAKAQKMFAISFVIAALSIGFMIQGMIDMNLQMAAYTKTGGRH